MPRRHQLRLVLGQVVLAQQHGLEPSRPQPPRLVDSLLVLAFDQYAVEREACRPARDCDFVLVNLFREPLGAPMPPSALNELLADLSRRARLDRRIHPHMLRHSALTHAAEDGANTATLLAYSGHTSVASLARYARVSPEALARWQARRDPAARRR